MITAEGNAALIKEGGAVRKALFGMAAAPAKAAFYLGGHAIQGVGRTAWKHPVLVGAPLVALMMSLAGPNNPFKANTAYVDPMNNDYYLEPGILSPSIKKVPYVS